MVTNQKVKKKNKISEWSECEKYGCGPILVFH